MTTELAIKSPLEINSNLTPMMRQYLEIKNQYQDAILFYRLGDFYEMFFDDAVVASKILDLTLTARNKSDNNPIPLCGIPYHSAEGYIAKLVQEGRKVVVCEQVEDPKLAKGIVKREVTRVITPGTVLEAQSLDATSNNFLLCLKRDGSQYHCVVCDVSTGKLEHFTLASIQAVRDEIARLQIKEIIYPEAQRNDDELRTQVFENDHLYHHAVSDLHFDTDFASDVLKRQYAVTSLASLDLQDKGEILSVLGGLLGYLKDAKLLTSDLLAQPVERVLSDHMLLDETTVTHLELFKTSREQKRHGTLLWHLDSCATAMGSRKLCELLRSPLLSVAKINARLEAVEEVVKDETLKEDLVKVLAAVADLERLANRFVLKTANARDAVSLKTSLVALKPIKTLLTERHSALLKSLGGAINSFDDMTALIEQTLQDEPPISTRDGKMIRDGFSAELDDLRRIERSG
jgi:DNA mismatch repair protein MutS